MSHARFPIRIATGLLLAALALAAAPAVKVVPAEGAGVTGQAALAQMKSFARAQCKRLFGPERDGFTLRDMSCTTTLWQRETITCRAKAACDGSAYVPAPTD